MGGQRGPNPALLGAGVGGKKNMGGYAKRREGNRFSPPAGSNQSLPIRPLLGGIIIDSGMDLPPPQRSVCANEAIVFLRIDIFVVRGCLGIARGIAWASSP